MIELSNIEPREITHSDNIIGYTNNKEVVILTPELNRSKNGALLANGSTLEFTIGNITAKLTRKDANTISISLTSTVTQIVNVANVTWGGSTSDAMVLTPYELSSTPTDLPDVGTGLYTFAKYRIVTDTHAYNVEATRNADYSLCNVIVNGYLIEQ